MTQAAGSAEPSRNHPSARSSRRTRWLLAALIAVAVLVRIPAIRGVPFDVSGGRQLHAAIISRGYETRLRPPADPDAASRRIAAADDQGIIEPPLLQITTGALWAVFGEHLWIPRLLATLGFLSGAVALWAVADRLVGRVGAWIAFAFYAVNSFGLRAATSMQPEPLQVGALCFVLLTGLRWADEPTRWNKRVALVAAAVTVFVKPSVAPVIITGVLALRLERAGLRAWFKDRDNLRYIVAAAAPALVFFAFGTVFGVSATARSGDYFILPLLWDPSFWNGWLREISQVVTLPLFVVAVVGLIVCARSSLRAMGLGALVGYGVYGIAFDYRISTHDYYSLPLIPIVALGLAAAGSYAVKSVPRYAPIVAVAATLLLALGVVLFWRDERQVHREAVPIVAELRTIGEVVDHRAVVDLSGDNASSQMFYGDVWAAFWPSAADLELERLQGKATEPVSVRLAKLRVAVGADFFVVNEPAELRAQPELSAFLDGLPVLYRSDTGIVYRLPTR